MEVAGASLYWGPILPPAKCRRRSCARGVGRPPKAAATGRWLDAPLRPVSISRLLNWRRRTGPLRRWAKPTGRANARRWRAHHAGQWWAQREERLCPPYFFPIISFAAIRPPPAISTAAIAIDGLGL